MPKRPEVTPAAHIPPEELHDLQLRLKIAHLACVAMYLDPHFEAEIADAQTEHNELMQVLESRGIPLYDEEYMQQSTERLTAKSISLPARSPSPAIRKLSRGRSA
ncbi:hypothetical protein H0X10_00110 [Candidatus Saccharibacteria bacterium]|nr:hypothetical protein [Candidatus Saccharibacteria bacterium]